MSPESPPLGDPLAYATVSTSPQPVDNSRPNAAQKIAALSECMTPQQREELDAWKAAQLAKAPALDEATARRISAALYGTEARPATRKTSTRNAPAKPEAVSGDEAAA